MTTISEETCKVVLPGEEITTRPIQDSDIDLEMDFISKLSTQRKHYRFLGGVGNLSRDQLKQLCDIDFDHRMAFIASINTNNKEEEIGVARYAQVPGSDDYEFAVTVADKWQHKKIDSILVKHLIKFAKKHCVKRLYSINMADDHDMRKLATELHMKLERDPDDVHQVIYSLGI